MEAVSLTGVSVSHGGAVVVEVDRLSLTAGETVGLIGRSGSGKTSLLRVMVGLDRPDRGTVRVLGQPVPVRTATLVFSEDVVFDHLDVAGNLEFPLTGKSGTGEMVDATADLFWLRQLLERDPTTLSVGQRQVVAAARAVVRPEVEVVFVDEPLVGIDPHRRAHLLEAIMGRSETTVVFATNDPSDVRRWADRVVALDGGVVAQIGTPGEVYSRPASVSVAEIMGELNRFPGTIVASPAGWLMEVGSSTLRLDPAPAGLSGGERVVVGVRPSDLSAAAPGIPFDRRLRTTVGRVEPLGAKTRVLFGLGGEPGVAFAAEVPGVTGLGRHDAVDWFVPPDAIRLFDPVSGLAL